MKDTFKNVLSFEFWQKFGKALMVVIAVMPAAGLMISIGKSIVMINPTFAPLVITGGILEQIGWGVIGNLHILFALAIGGSWAKERAGGAFAAGLAFILINRITGTIFGVSGDMLKNPDAMVTTFFGGSIKVADYFISVLEAPALNCPLVLDCRVDRIVEEDGICHIFAKILERLVAPELLDEKGHFKNQLFAPTYFMGDGYQRVYRYLDKRVDMKGSFIKKARKKDGKN